MSGRPSETELQHRIAELLMTRDAGRAVARRLQTGASADKGAASCDADRPPRPFVAVPEPDPEAASRGYRVPSSTVQRQVARMH